MKNNANLALSTHFELVCSQVKNRMLPSTMSPAFATLMTLPPEIQLVIIDHLAFPENIHLKLTNRHFYALIPSFEPIDLKDLFAAEQSLCTPSIDEFGWSYELNSAFLACLTCYRIRPHAKFYKHGDWWYRASPVIKTHEIADSYLLRRGQLMWSCTDCITAANQAGNLPICVCCYKKCEGGDTTSHVQVCRDESCLDIAGRFNNSHWEMEDYINHMGSFMM